MKILYIYPHPDDESFGPAHAMSKQRREGHEVYLLTLTKGGATKQRYKLGYTVEEMGEIRKKEMDDVVLIYQFRDADVDIRFSFDKGRDENLSEVSLKSLKMQNLLMTKNLVPV